MSDDPRRAGIVKGKFMTSTPRISDVRLTREFPQFEESIKVANELHDIKQRHAANIAELAQRLHKVREQIDMVKAKAKCR